MTTRIVKRPSSKLKWGLVLIGVVIVGVIVFAILPVQVQQVNQSRLAKIEQAVRASFPRFCQGGQLLIVSPTEHPDLFLGTVNPDEYLIGCDATGKRFGYAFQLNVVTCKMLLTSLTLMSELGDTLPPSAAPKMMSVCPVF